MRHLVSIANLIRDEIADLMDEAGRFKEVIRGRETKKLPTLRSRTIYNLFCENSTYIRLSFETTGKWMSADIINISASPSFAKKGESLKDTALTLDAIGGDAIAVRHPSSRATQLIAKWTEEFGSGPSIIDTGDGEYQHPTRTLLDVMTLRQRLGGVEGRKIAIVGDILHSRVTRSNADLLSKFGAKVVFAAPPTLLPFGIETWPTRVAYRMEDEIRDVNAVIMLRVQQERMHGGFFPSHREYTIRYELPKVRERMLHDDRIVVHPGPMPHDTEVSDAVANLPRTAVLQQVANGVHVRMTVLFILLILGVSVNLEGQAQMSSRNEYDEASCPEVGSLAASARRQLLFKGVRPHGEGEDVDVLIGDGAIVGIGGNLTAGGGVEVLEFDSLVLLSGLVDTHACLREPNRGGTETLVTGSATAARDGFTAAFTMVNTAPVTDDPLIAESIWPKGQALNLCGVHPVDSITKGLRGEALTEFGMMIDSQAKVCTFSDSGKCVDNPPIMCHAIEYARSEDVLPTQYCEDPRSTVDASAHKGPTAACLDPTEWSRAVEGSTVTRNAIMTRDYGGHMHICRVSTEGTVELIKWAKEHDTPLTVEVTPHHLILTDKKLGTYDGVYHVNPPLRGQCGTLALRQTLINGVIDCIATDRTPHGSEEKYCEFKHAKPGMLGLETSMPIIAEEFVLKGDCDWRWLAKVTSERPAQIAKLPGHGRPIAVGKPTNLTVIDPGKKWTIHGGGLASKSENTPYEEVETAVSVTAAVLCGGVTALDGGVVG